MGLFTASFGRVQHQLRTKGEATEQPAPTRVPPSCSESPPSYAPPRVSSKDKGMKARARTRQDEPTPKKKSTQPPQDVGAREGKGDRRKATQTSLDRGKKDGRRHAQPSSHPPSLPVPGCPLPLSTPRQLILSRGASYAACSLPPGATALTVFGQTGAGKSTVGNVLVASGAEPAAGSCNVPFHVAKANKPETKWVTSALSEAKKRFVTDTPGLTLMSPTAADDVSQKGASRLSDQAMQSLMHVINSDGGYLVWVVPGVGPTSETLQLAEAMNKCLPPSWPSQTMVVSTRPLRADLPDLEGAGGEEDREVLASEFAHEHDQAALLLLNKSLRGLALQFANLTTYIPGHCLFTGGRLVERVTSMMSQRDPLLANCTTSWSASGRAKASVAQQPGVRRVRSSSTSMSVVSRHGGACVGHDVRRTSSLLKPKTSCDPRKKNHLRGVPA